MVREHFNIGKTKQLTLFMEWEGMKSPMSYGNIIIMVSTILTPETVDSKLLFVIFSLSQGEHKEQVFFDNTCYCLYIFHFLRWTLIPCRSRKCTSQLSGNRD